MTDKVLSNNKNSLWNEDKEVLKYLGCMLLVFVGIGVLLWLK